jgi:hypothetical protein
MFEVRDILWKAEKRKAHHVLHTLYLSKKLHVWIYQAHILDDIGPSKLTLGLVATSVDKLKSCACLCHRLGRTL